MSNFNIMGSYSGIDMSVIDKMIEAEKAKGVKFTNQKDKIEREQGAWKDVGSRLTSLNQKIDALGRRSTFEARTVNSTARDNSAVSVTAGNSAPVGNYQINVKQLASSTQVVGGQVTIPSGDDKTKPIDRELGIKGSFNFRNDENQSFKIEVSKGDSLREISRNINARTEDSGIEASIVDNRLILKDTQMGDRKITIEQGTLEEPDSTSMAEKLGFGNTTTKTHRLSGAELIKGETTLANFLESINGTKITIGTDKNSPEVSFENVKSLKDVADQINAQTLTKDDDSGNYTGIAASINDGKLVLTDEQGELKADKITGTDDALETLGFKSEISFEELTDITIESEGKDENTSPEGAFSTKGTQAKFSINGVDIEPRDTNRISDAIEGISFTLESVHTDGASEVISITNNTQKGVDAMKEFVDQYNSVMNFIQTQTDVGTPGEDNNTVGALVGEGSIMRLQSGLRSTLMQSINGKSMSDFGVEIDRYGVATLDEAKLNEVLQEDPTSLSRFFYRPELAPDGAGDIPEGEEPKDTKGMSELFKNFLETYTAKSKGIISTKQQSYDRMVKSINEQIDTFNVRIDKKRDRYIKQFAALDEAMMRAESQMEYLYSQMNIE